MSVTAIAIERLPKPVERGGVASASQGGRFGAYFDAALRLLPDTGWQSSMAHITQALENRTILSPQTLLLYQIRLSRFGLAVELVSKLGDSAMNTVRHLQQGGSV